MSCFCFVILHYQTVEDTIDCVNSILLNITDTEYEVIIVDNGSPNKSGAVLAETFKTNPKIKLIFSETNLGFTAGNNLGFEYAKKELNADFIALINNDTIIPQSDFVKLVVKKHNEMPFDILGPDIVTFKGRHQSPVFNKMSNLQVVDKYIRFYRKILLLNYLGLDNILERIKKFFVPVSSLHLENIKTEQDSTTEQKGVMLHGSALIFSKSYIDKYDGLYPGPFMYGEEAILDFISKRDNLSVLFYPEIKIIHKDDSATDTLFRKPLKKRRFYLKNFLKSSGILQLLMKEQ
jgi:GT2 family glycosyltransferase